MALITHHASLITAFVALGANVGDPPAQIRAGLLALEALPQTRVIAQSALYRNPPEGGMDQPEYVNAVARIETALGPRALLDRLLEIERAHGRVREFPNAPRMLDLDIALYGDRVVDEPGLTIPHPRMTARAFVLLPLCEIAPDAVVPGHGRVADLARKVDASGMTRLPEHRNG